MSGGVAVASRPRKPDRARTRRSNSGYAAASAAERGWSSVAVRVASAHRVSARPSGWGAKTRASGCMRVRPWRFRPSSR